MEGEQHTGVEEEDQHPVDEKALTELQQCINAIKSQHSDLEQWLLYQVISSSRARQISLLKSHWL
jgi:hypothetical protein